MCLLHSSRGVENRKKTGVEAAGARGCYVGDAFYLILHHEVQILDMRRGYRAMGEVKRPSRLRWQAGRDRGYRATGEMKL